MQSVKIDGFDPMSFLNSIGSGSSIAQYRAGQTVFSQGDPADKLYYVQQGRVQISIISDAGREGVTAIHGPGELFGQETLGRPCARRSNATTIGLAVLTRIDNRALMRAMRAESSSAIMFLSFLLWRNVQIEDDLVDHLFNSSEKRLARHLLKLANLDAAELNPGDIESVIIPKMSQEILASRIGTTRGRINYFMNKFRRLGYIDYDAAIIVRSSLVNILLEESAAETGEISNRPAGLARPIQTAPLKHPNYGTSERKSGAPWLGRAATVRA